MHFCVYLCVFSDTALVHPESCIFAELLNFGALFGTNYTNTDVSSAYLGLLK